ncbi:dolichyl-diphosphooligosaccharide--protein glycosyltransferase subunit 1 [Rhodotorula kratochvilovae]
MRFPLLSVPLLGAALAAALASPEAARSAFSPSSLPSSAWAPSALSSTIELAGSLARSTAAYTLRKDYGHADQGDSWIVGVKGAPANGGFVEAVEGKGNARRKVDITPLGSDDETTYYQLALVPPHSSDMTFVTLSVVLPHATRPEPPAMPQNADSIFMLFEGDLLAPLAGLSTAQRAKLTEMKVRFKTPTPRIVSATSPDGFVLHQQSGSATLTFTLQGDAATLPPQVARVHYQQPEAIASIRRLDRLVELSHWGANLAIQDTIDLFNAGPKLLGQFARIDYQKALMHRRQHLTAISSLSLELPPSTHNPYFYDVVGNVSTSRFRPSSSSSASNKPLLPSQKRRAQQAREPTVLELQPRYPLLGGWNYSFTIGYDLPLGEYVKAREGAGKGQYVAAVPILTPVKDVAVDEVRVEIRLPEGARDIAVHAPFPLTSLSVPSSSSPATGENLAWTYLDSTGRPTVVLTKHACTDRHGGDVLIEYTLPPLADALQKPLACASVLLALFVAIIAAKRVSCGIRSPREAVVAVPVLVEKREK